ncbi:hypothetical protein ACMA1I_04745 [Pontibacter sp. 13R65]|uniref:hypothetical protein n=1 Tax=Pontibacter sp. 13R65 TaxID=3127458 RepID=UPI00301CE40A
MKRLRVPITVIVSAYGSILLLLAAIFLMRDQTLHSLQTTLPLTFLMRFGAFWFISFLLAVIIYLVNLNLNYMGIPATQRKHGTRLGTFVLGAGSLFLMVALLLLTYLSF